MKALLEHIIHHLVDHPKEVVITESLEENQYIYRISLHVEDIGKIIGKKGNIIQAIRAIAKVPAMKEHTLIRIFVSEPSGEGLH